MEEGSFKIYGGKLKKNLRLFKLKEEVFQREPPFLTGTQVAFYVDKINLLYYLLSWTLIVL